MRGNEWSTFSKTCTGNVVCTGDGTVDHHLPSAQSAFSTLNDMAMTLKTSSTNAEELGKLRSYAIARTIVDTHRLPSKSYKVPEPSEMTSTASPSQVLCFRVCGNLLLTAYETTSASLKSLRTTAPSNTALHRGQQGCQR